VDGAAFGRSPPSHTSSDVGVMDTVNRREDRLFHSLVGFVASQYRIG
jgi:hypothetical protein